MATPFQSYPAPMFSPFTLPVAYYHRFPHIGYGPPLFSYCERDCGIFAVPLPTSLSYETYQAGLSTICPTYYTAPISRCTSLEPPSYKKDTDDSPVFLTDAELWKLFYSANNEMIVTKPGR